MELEWKCPVLPLRLAGAQEARRQLKEHDDCSSDQRKQEFGSSQEGCQIFVHV